MAVELDQGKNTSKNSVEAGRLEKIRNVANKLLNMVATQIAGLH